MTQYQRLFSPMKIGKLDIPNRVFMSPHGMISLGIGTDQQVGYFEARARGGAGFLGIASCQVMPETLLPDGMWIRAYARDDIPAIRRIADGVHKWGAKTFVQGVWMQANPSLAQASGMAPHTVLSDSQPRSMTIDEIEALIEAHIVAATHAQEAGADGFEMPISGGAGLQCFTSNLYNHRTDQYGGSLENRLRVITRIIDGISDRCGRDFALGFAVNADEGTLGGNGLAEGIAICKILEGTGKVDWLRITARGQKPQMTHYHYPSSYMSEGTHLYAAAEVKKNVAIPVVSGGRILTPQFAEQALEDGKVDMVFMARSLIADPQWPAKVRSGKTEEIRACIGDLEGCFMRSLIGQFVGCTVNPEIGKEHVALTPAARARKVVIAGGGVAGMQAAMIAAQRGHTVTLLEKRDALGGHVLWQAKLPGLEDRSDIVRWLELQLGKLEVDVRRNTEATPKLIADLGADVVVVATGATYSRTGTSKNQLTPVEGHDIGHGYVLTPENHLLDSEPVGKRVVVYDNTSYEVGPGIAELLADQGKEVIFVTIDAGLAESVKEIGINKVIAKRLLPKVTFLPNMQMSSIDVEKITLHHHHTGEPTELVGVDNVILVTSKPPREELYHALLGKVPELHIIGDAREARWSVFATDDAIKDGHRVGLLV